VRDFRRPSPVVPRAAVRRERGPRRCRPSQSRTPPAVAASSAGDRFAERGQVGVVLGDDRMPSASANARDGSVSNHSAAAADRERRQHARREAAGARAPRPRWKRQRYSDHADRGPDSGRPPIVAFAAASTAPRSSVRAPSIRSRASTVRCSHIPRCWPRVAEHDSRDRPGRDQPGEPRSPDARPVGDRHPGPRVHQHSAAHQTGHGGDHRRSAAARSAGQLDAAGPVASTQRRDHAPAR